MSAMKSFCGTGTCLSTTVVCYFMELEYLQYLNITCVMVVVVVGGRDGGGGGSGRRSSNV